MKISLIIIGDEILNGRTIDKNTKWLGQFLEQLGLNLSTVIIISDNQQSIIKAITSLSNNNDIIITSGGIGPTKDDLTKESLAIYLNETLVDSEDAAFIAKTNYLRINKEWNKSFNNYSFIPPSVTPINNPTGLAPGLIYQNNLKTILCAPGVPSEFSTMIEKEFSSYILQHKKYISQKISKITFRTYKIPEEVIFSTIPNLWENLSCFGKVSSLPHIAGVDIILTLENNDSDQILEQIKNFESVQKLLKHTWQIGNKTLPEYVVLQAIKKKITFSIAESCTGGLISSRITDVPNSSKVFLGSTINYSNKSKEDLIGVSPETITNFGAVSEETAQEMANGVLNKFNSDLSISTTGIAGPSGGSIDKPVGTVAIGSSTKKETKSFMIKTAGNRARLKEKFSEYALFELLDLIND